MTVTGPAPGAAADGAGEAALAALASLPTAVRVRDDLLARELAVSAGRRLLGLREQAPRDPAALRTAGDRAGHEFLVAALAAARPGDAVLSEEGRDDPARLSAERVWIVDPLDGTREYGEGRADWAVHVALWAAGRLAAGAVALPGRRLVLATADPPRLPARRDGPLRLAVSRSRPPAGVSRLAELLGGQLVLMGSAGVKVAAVLLGEVDAYVHAGGQYEWDSAAPVAVALAAGAHASRLDGAPLRYNAPDPLLPDLLVCRADLAHSLLDQMRRSGLASTR